MPDEVAKTDEQRPQPLLELTTRTLHAIETGWVAALGSGLLLGGASVFLGVIFWIVGRSGRMLRRLGRRGLQLDVDDPLFSIALVAVASLLMALVVAGPLAAFGLAARRRRARVDDALRRAVPGALRLALLYTAQVTLLLLPLFLVGKFQRIGLAFYPVCFVACAVPIVAVRYLALASVVLVVEREQSLGRTLVRAVELARGRVGLFAFASLGPVILVIAAAMGPSRIGRDLLVDAFGWRAATTLFYGFSALSGLLALWLGCAIKAGAYDLASRDSAPPGDGMNAP